MNGIVTQINTTLQVNPEQINDAPYKTWIFAFESSDEASIQQLLDASAYQALTE
jgi:glycine cleavage system H protein